MFKLMLISFMLLSGSVFASGNMNHGSSTKEMKKRTMLPEAGKKEVLAVLKANEKLHTSFFKYNAKRVETNAKAVADAIGKIKNADIKKLLSFSKGKLEEIKADRNRKDNDQSYHQFSMAAIHVLKKYDLGKDYNAYSCPMVKKQWVQNSTKVSKVYNPYAPEMPHCGGMDTHFH
ncbi:MAG: DUF3347 domain-containing protein [Bacteriovoracaceae bacterium]|nr:DUF3347 domain-containing protein [Bacteriovoracaceae bacterium]